MTPARRLWLVDATVAGVPMRWAVEDLEVQTADGDTLLYSAGLQDFEAGRGDDSVSIEVLDPTIDWPAVGPLVEGSPVVVRRWTEGDVIERADVFFRGVAEGSEYGTAEEGAAWSIVEPMGVESLGNPMPDLMATVSDETWDIPLDDQDAPQGWVGVGVSYPVLFGYPGWDGVGITPVVPVPMVQLDEGDPSNTLVVISSDPDAPITSCTLWNDDVSAGAVEDVSRVTDLLGRRILVADFGNDSTIALTSSDDRASFFAGFSPSGGGGVARTAYEVIRYVLAEWGGSSVDWDRLRDVEDWLSVYQVDDWLDEPATDPWSWLENNLLPDLPVELRSSAVGRYLVPLRFRPLGRAVGQIVAGEGVTRVGRSKLILPARNELSARYCVNRDGDPTAGLILTGNTSPGSAPTALDVAGPTRVIVSETCRASQARHGIRVGDVIDLDWCCDLATAQAVLSWMADRDAPTVRQIAYLVEGGERFSAGDEVELIDDELGFDVVALVDGAPSEGPQGVTLTLRLVED